MNMKKLAVTLTLFSLIIVLSCVRIPSDLTLTANITVDIRHIEEQANNILDYTEEKTDALPGMEEDTEAESNNRTWLMHTIDAVSPIRRVYAAGLKSTSDLVTKLAKKMRDRNKQIAVHKKAGYLGENNRGYVEVMVKKFPKDDPKAAELKNEVQKLATAENADRKALYKEIAKLNSDAKVTLTQVESIYAMTRLNRAKPGEIFQLPPKGENFDKFKKTKIGMKLGKKCVPKAWVTIKK